MDPPSGQWESFLDLSVVAFLLKDMSALHDKGSFEDNIANYNTDCWFYDAKSKAIKIISKKERKKPTFKTNCPNRLAHSQTTSPRKNC